MDFWFFDPFGDPQTHESRLAACKSDPVWQRVYQFLASDSYWHATSPEAWKAISLSGAIKPNIGGSFHMRYDLNTQRSYGYSQKAIALFDFTGPTEEEIIQTFSRACDILTAKETMILLRLDRATLLPKIIPNAQWRIADRAKGGAIPFCEVWYPEEIETRIITGVFQVPPASRNQDFDPQPIDRWL